MNGRPSSEYVEWPPPAALAPYVACLWVQRVGDGDGPYRQPVLPDACVDIVAVDDAVVVAGPSTHGAVLTMRPNTYTAGVRFRSGAAPALLGISAKHLRDHDRPLDDLWGSRGDAVADRVLAATSGTGRIERIVDELLRRIGGAREVDPVGVGIGPMLLEAHGAPLADLAASVGLGERQLRRRVEDAVGYPPRTLVRVLRFQRFLDAARAADPSRRQLAVLAAGAGYADQAHLTRDSRDLTGLPPAALLDWEAERLAG